MRPELHPITESYKQITVLCKSSILRDKLIIKYSSCGNIQ